MSENEAASTRVAETPDQWQTIAEAAKALDISERTVRRAAMMPENAAQTRQETRRTKTGTRQATFLAPELVEKLREEHRQNAAPELFQHGETQANSDNKAQITQTTPAEQRGATLPIVAKQGHERGANAATPAQRGNEADTIARVLAERECVLLREALQRERENADQWRNQVEAANRDAAELRAALRKALDAMPKQITAADVELRNATPQTPVAETSSGSQPTGQQPTARREPRPLWKLILGMR